MTWLQIDDNMSDHPKIAALSDAAFRDHIEGLSYCARQLTDGFVPAKTVREITTKRTLFELVSEQVPGKKPLWEQVEKGCIIHDYLEYNPSRETVMAKREARAEAGRKGGSKRSSKRQAFAIAPATTFASPPLLSSLTTDSSNQEDPTENGHNPTATPNHVLVLLHAIDETEYSSCHAELMAWIARGSSEHDFREVARAISRRRDLKSKRAYAVKALRNRIDERSTA